HPTSSFFSFNDTPTTKIYTLSLHDALPILINRRNHGRNRIFTNPSMTTCPARVPVSVEFCPEASNATANKALAPPTPNSGFNNRSEEHTSELQSPCNLVCRLLLEKKKKKEK